MKKYISFVAFTLVCLLNSCTVEDGFTTYCIDFDLRQCDGNPWLIDNQVPDSTEDHLALVSDYLKEHNINVLHREIDMRPDIIVCQACFHCPAGPRIRVEVVAEDTAAVYRLDLLNVSTVECPDEF